MSAASALTFSELAPELFRVIVEHLPFVFRPSTLLSLALTCHRLHDVVFPQLVYDTVRLVGEDQALTTLDILIAKAELQVVTEEDIQQQGNPSLSHCIHHLCLDSSIETPIRTRSSLDALQKLIEVNGLRHLLSLTIQAVSVWDGTRDDNETGHLKLPTSFVLSLKMRCPNLKRIQLSDFSQDFGKEWVEPHIFSHNGLTSIHIESDLFYYPIPTINVSGLPPNLHTLELRLNNGSDARVIDARELLSCVIPNLRTLILDDIAVSDSDPHSTTAFWRAHPGIERLELYYEVDGNWFTDLEVGMLTNLKYLLCNVDQALALLPRVSMSLITLGIRETYNAQGLYLLRVVSQGGVLPALRSLGIDSDSGNSPKPREGHRWREDSNGVVSMADAKKPAKPFDGNYIMSLSKAAPNLEELELMGRFNDTLDSLTTSLSMFPRLRRLTISGAINGHHKSFFARSPNWAEYTDFRVGGIEEKDYGKYAPATFEEAVRDLANGCRTLEAVTVGTILGKLSIKDGLSRRVVRECERGLVKELKKTQAFGNIIGREDRW